LSALEDPIRIDALRLVDLLLQAIPAELVRGFDPHERGARELRGELVDELADEGADAGARVGDQVGEGGTSPSPSC
jgi:hypothetical protein